MFWELVCVLFIGAFLCSEFILVVDKSTFVIYMQLHTFLKDLKKKKDQDACLLKHLKLLHFILLVGVLYITI